MNSKNLHIRNLFTFCILVLTLVSCASAGAPKRVMEEAVAPLPPAPADQASAAVAGEAKALPGAPSTAGMVNKPESGIPAKRMVIKNVDMTIVVEDAAKSVETFAAMADEMGGFVVTSRLFQSRLSSGEEIPQGEITIRVPADKLDEATKKIKGDAIQVQNENTSGQDVTREYTDLQSRLRNLEAAEADLVKIMDKAYQTEDVMSVYNQITQIREQIEVVKGQIQFYDQSSTYSAITIKLLSKASIQPVSVGGWQPVGVARDAIQTLINALKGLANVAIWLILFFLPLIIVLAIPVVIVVLILRRFIKRNKTGKAVVSAKEESNPASKEEKKD